jgi:hypothetical protein
MALHIVQSREEVATAIATGASKMVTPPDFVCMVGVGYALEMQAHAAPSVVVFGCGADAALVHDAIRNGIQYIYSDMPPLLFVKLASIAKEKNITLIADYPTDAVDISTPKT